MEHDPVQQELVDVGSLTLRQLMESDNPTLRESVRRVIDQLEDPNGVLSAFNSFITDEDHEPVEKDPSQ